MKFLPILLISWFGVASSANCFGQSYQSYAISANGDTINIIDHDGKKQGKWVIQVDELRGEPGYEEEGMFKDNVKDGIWRRYTLQGDLIAVENYKMGGKDGLQQYYTFLGNLEREESWKGFNPDSPYDTIPVYGADNNEVLEYRIVEAAPYSVKHGTWKFYNDGILLRTEEYDRNNLVSTPRPVAATDQEAKPKKIEKTPEMMEWDKKNSGKKKGMRDGQTSL